jgi:RNA-directed DNA polymerase
MDFPLLGVAGAGEERVAFGYHPRGPLCHRHTHIHPKGDGRRRPVGMPAMDDTLVQSAVARRVDAISAQDFLRCSSGYRPQVGPLDAVRTLTSKLPCGRYGFVVEADLKGGFDTIDQAWLRRMLEERMADRALRRLIPKWRKAGGLETDGQVIHPATGTPQGGVGALRSPQR